MCPSRSRSPISSCWRPMPRWSISKSGARTTLRLPWRTFACWTQIRRPCSRSSRLVPRQNQNHGHLNRSAPLPHQQAFAQRYQVVSDLAQNSLKGDSSDKVGKKKNRTKYTSAQTHRSFFSGQTRRLDSLEDSLFRLGVKSDQQFQRWLRRRSHIITIVPSADRPPPKRSRLFSLND